MRKIIVSCFLVLAAMPFLAGAAEANEQPIVVDQRQLMCQMLRNVVQQLAQLSGTAPLDISSICPDLASGPASVRVVWPNGGENLQQGQTYRLQWTGINFPSYSWAGLALQDKSGVSTLLSDLTNNLYKAQKKTGSIDWTVPASLAPGEYKLVVWCGIPGGVCSPDKLWSGNLNAQDLSDNFFNVVASDVDQPSVEIVRPAGNEQWEIGSNTTRRIRWEAENMPAGAVAVIKLVDGPTPFRLTNSRPARAETYNFSVPETGCDGDACHSRIEAGSYKVKIEIYNVEPCVGESVPGHKCLNARLLTSDTSETAVTLTSSANPEPDSSVTLKVNNSNGPLKVPFDAPITLSWTSKDVNQCVAYGAGIKLEDASTWGGTTGALSVSTSGSQKAYARLNVGASGTYASKMEVGIRCYSASLGRHVSDAVVLDVAQATVQPSDATITVTSTMPNMVHGNTNYMITWTDSLTGPYQTNKYNILLRGKGTGVQYPIKWSHEQTGATKSYQWVGGDIVGNDELPDGEYYITVCHDFQSKCSYSNTFMYEPAVMSSVSPLNAMASVLNAMSSLLQRFK
ncbi:MAG TPA: hypothetical protein VEB60_01525 [Candidatus Paceibacterota bacterium]|nr:hypothetical protein [Candidatus Paceibacterota bacterium]